MTIDFSKFNNLKILVIGDVMLDQFIYGSVSRISPEAPVPVLKVKHNNEMLGGAGNVVNNLLALNTNVVFLSLIGEDASGKKIQSMLESKEKLESYLYVDDDFQTVTKTRFVGGTQHLVRIDQEKDFIMSSDLEDQIISKFLELAPLVDVIIISDYNKGLITTNLKKAIAATKTPAKKILDTKGSLKEYSGRIDYITPNIKETEHYSGISINSPETMSAAASHIAKTYSLNKILITASEDGMYLYDAITDHPLTGFPIWKIQHQRALNNSPVDISGAGDTVIAALSIAIGLEYSDAVAMEFASQCAAISVGKSGTSIVTIDEIKEKYVVNINHEYTDIIKLNGKLESIRDIKIIGFVNGCFDVLHVGHLSMLEQAREKCDFLVVGLNSDVSVAQLKGDERPIISELDRAKMLSSLKCVDAVIIFNELEPSNTIQQIRPNMVIKSKQYENVEIPEKKIIDDIDCELHFVDSKSNQSTTQIIESIKK